MSLSETFLLAALGAPKKTQDSKLIILQFHSFWVVKPLNTEITAFNSSVLRFSSEDYTSMDHGLEVNWETQKKDNEGLQVNHDHEGLQNVSLQKNETPLCAENWDHYRNADYHEEDAKRRILGLSVFLFWVLIGVFVLILAGGIGGGVAGGLAAQKKITNSSPQAHDSSATSSQLASTTNASRASSSSSSQSTTSAATSGPSPAIRSPCTNNPAANGTVLTATDASGTDKLLSKTAYTFTLLCHTNYPAGSANGNPNVTDLYTIYTIDMAGCIEACVAYNLGYAVQKGYSPKCAVAAVVKRPGSFCYLKSATGVNNTKTNLGPATDSAVLID